MQIFNVLFVVTKNYFDLIHYKSCIFSFCCIFIRFFCFHYASAQFLFVCIIHKLFTVNLIHSALLFNCMKSFYIVLSQSFVPRSGTMFLSVFVVLYFVFLCVNFST